MASIDTGGDSGGGHGNKPGVKKAKKLSTKVEMTPMVDLGFLLISFFMFTTTLANQKTMEVRVPSTEDASRPTVFVDEANPDACTTAYG